MRKLPRRFYFGAAGLIVVALALTLAAHLSRSEAQTTGSISFDAVELSFTPNTEGGEMMVPIYAANVNDVDGYDLWLSFDPSVLRLTSLYDDGFLHGYNSDGWSVANNDPVICLSPTITANSGHIACQTLSLKAVFEMGPYADLGAYFPVTRVSVDATPMPIAYAYFLPVAPGTSHLSLTTGPSQSSGLNDVNSTPISVSLGTANLTLAPPSGVGGIAERPDAAALPSQQASDPNRRMAYASTILLLPLAVLALLYWRRKRSHHA